MNECLLEQIKGYEAFGIEVNEWDRREIVHAFSTTKARDEWVERAKARMAGKTPSNSMTVPNARRKAKKEEVRTLLENAQKEQLYGVRPVIHRTIA